MRIILSRWHQMAHYMSNLLNYKAIHRQPGWVFGKHPRAPGQPGEVRSFRRDQSAGSLRPFSPRNRAAGGRVRRDQSGGSSQSAGTNPGGQSDSQMFCLGGSNQNNLTRRVNPGVNPMANFLLRWVKPKQFNPPGQSAGSIRFWVNPPANVVLRCVKPKQFNPTGLVWARIDPPDWYPPPGSTPWVNPPGQSAGRPPRRRTEGGPIGLAQACRLGHSSPYLTARVHKAFSGAATSEGLQHAIVDRLCPSRVHHSTWARYNLHEAAPNH